MTSLIPDSASGRDFRTHLTIMGGLVVVACFVLLGRLYVLQVSRGEEYVLKSKSNYVKEVKLPASRGIIYDRKGRVLVDNRPSYDVQMIPAFCQPSCLDEVLPKAATYLGLTPEEIERVKARFRRARKLKAFRAFPVKIDVSLDERDLFLANQAELPGFDLLPMLHRNYPHGMLLAHVLGYMNEVSEKEMSQLNEEGAQYELGDYLGRIGVERSLESYLRGDDGIDNEVVDAKGRAVSTKSDLLTEAQKHPKKAVPGHNAVLSIDQRLQEVAEKAFPGRGGAVVAMNPNNGFVMAMVSRPAFDPNVLTGRVSAAVLQAMSEDPLHPLIFRPAQGQYAPGSTFKPITALAGLKAGAIHPEASTFCNGGYTLGRRTWRCWADRGHGAMNLHQALVHSCDVFFYSVADRLGIDPIAEMGSELGLGKGTGIDFSTEKPGLMPSTEYHNRVTPGGYQRGLALNTAIGQGDDMVTPLQLALAYAAIANGGTLYRPQVVKRVEDLDGRPIKVFEPQEMGRLEVKKEYLKMVVEGLKGVVNEPGGTAWFHRLPDVAVAGKTGTAQVIRIGEERTKLADMKYEERDHAWFVAFAPADDPEIVVAVLNEHAGHGSSAAAPAAVEVIKGYFKIKAEEEAARNAPPPAEPEKAPSGREGDKAVPPGPQKPKEA